MDSWCHLGNPVHVKASSHDLKRQTRRKNVTVPKNTNEVERETNSFMDSETIDLKETHSLSLFSHKDELYSWSVISESKISVCLQKCRHLQWIDWLIELFDFDCGIIWKIFDYSHRFEFLVHFWPDASSKSDIFTVIIKIKWSHLKKSERCYINWDPPKKLCEFSIFSCHYIV